MRTTPPTSCSARGGFFRASSSSGLHALIKTIRASLVVALQIPPDLPIPALVKLNAGEHHRIQIRLGSRRRAAIGKARSRIVFAAVVKPDQMAKLMSDNRSEIRLRLTGHEEILIVQFNHRLSEIRGPRGLRAARRRWTITRQRDRLRGIGPTAIFVD